MNRLFSSFFSGSGGLLRKADDLFSSSCLSGSSQRIALEPRIVFDGAGAVTSIEVLSSGVDSHDAGDVGGDGDSGDYAGGVNVSEVAGVADNIGKSLFLVEREVAFIDRNLPEAQKLVDGLHDDVFVFFLDPDTDGVGQVGRVLSLMGNVRAVHLFTHADGNGFRLGDSLITAESLDQSAEGFESWGNSLSENADIMFYGCSLAGNVKGQELVSRIGELTGADVAASTDLTGAEVLGGDWDLEFSRGIIETSLAITGAGREAYGAILAAVPDTSISSVTSDPLVGEQITFTVTFDNTHATDAGYGPYVNLFMPYLGADGVYDASTDTYTSAADGLSFVSATYLGASVEATTTTLEDIDAGTAGIQFEHPLAVDTSGSPVVVTLDPSLGLSEGDQLILLKLPFGSYTADQPAADIVVTANISSLADVGSTLNIISDAGFQYGNTALDDYDSDPSIQATTLTGANTASAGVTPQVFRVNTVLNAPENETATGENFNRSYDIEVEVASGQVIDNASIDFTFSEEMVYTSGSATGGGVLDTSNLGQASGGDSSDDVLSVDFAMLSGTQTVTANFYVSENDQSGGDVLDPLTGASRDLGAAGNVVVSGSWTPTDGRDSVAAVSDTSTATSIAAKSIAVQKSVSIVSDTGYSGATPGDVLEYTISIQVSDFFAYDTITVEDIFEDGQLVDGSFTPTLTVTRQGTAEGTFNFTNGTDYTDTTLGNDDHRLDFDVSALLISQLGSGILEGGKFGSDDLGSTTAVIKFRTIIQDEYDSSTNPNLFLKQGDTLANSVTVEGRLLDASLSPVAGPVMVSDTSSASVTIPNESVSLSVYALNGSTAGTLTNIKPGDDVTFRLEYDLVTGDFEDFFLKAYLPLPIFSVNDIDADGAGGDSFTFDSGSAIPAVGDYRYGPTVTADVETGVPTPAVTLDTTSNYITFDMGDLSDNSNDGGKIDILFTIRATDDPFADGLLLTTLSEQSDDNTPTDTTVTNDLGQITLQQPEITKIVKGVVATNVAAGSSNSIVYTDDQSGSTVTPSNFKDAGNTDANPLSGVVSSNNLSSLHLDNDLSGVDEGDLVRFAIIIENTGSSPNGAFDVTIKDDAIPAGFVTPAGGINLRAVNGAGTALTIETASPETALFAGGIRLQDGATGSIGEYNATDGTNIAIITYDLEVDNLVEAAASMSGTATLTNFANTEGGDDFTAVDLTDAATVTVAGASLSKSITDTDQASTSGNNVTVGEVVEYTLTIVVPEGKSSSAVLVDTLDAGMAFVGIDSITSSSGDLTTDVGGGFAGVQSGAVFSNVGGGSDNDGRRVTLDFGTLTNSNTDNSTAETITVVYRAVVVNSSASDGGAVLDNSAVWTTTNDSASADAPDVTVVEPQINVSVTPSTTQADTDDVITWTVVMSAPAGNLATAYDIALSDVIPAGLSYVAGSLVSTGGNAPSSLSEAGGTISGSWASFAPGDSSTFTFQTTIDAGAAMGDTLTDSATVTWESISGALGDVSSHTTADTERTGAGGINDFTSTGSGSVSVLFEDPALSLDSTSESNNGDDVTIGEIVRYRFKMRIPESTTSDFRIEPDIPVGMQFLNDGTATVAFISDGGLSADGAGLAGNGMIVGDETTVDTDEPVFAIPAGLIAGGPFGDGDNPQFRLGTLSNTDSDADHEFVVVEFNALVLNASSVNDGGSLSVDAESLSGATSLASTGNVSVDIVEPSLGNMVKKVVSSDGSSVTFQITFNNASGTDAFDVNVLDNLPANISNLGNVSVTAAGGVAGVTDNSNASSLDVDISSFPNGGSVTITYTADVDDNSAVIADTDARVTWTSVSGAAATLGGSSAGAAGGTTGERTGSLSPALNDYRVLEGAGLGVLSGRLWEDTDQDGNFDAGENVLGSTQINLVFAGDDGVFGNGDDISFSTQTDASGNYSFGALPAGDYRVSVQPAGSANGLPSGYSSVYDSQGGATDNLIEVTLGEGGNSSGNNFGVIDPNDAPSFADLGGAAFTPSTDDFDVSHTEDGAATVLDSDVTLVDEELDALDNWNGATIRIERSGGASADDVFGNSGTLAALTEGGNLSVGGSVVGTVTQNSSGTLLLTFNSNATGVLVDDVLQQVTYRFAGDATSSLVTLSYTVNDQNAGVQGTGGALSGSGSVVVRIVPDPDAPDGADKTFNIDEDTTITFAESDFGFSDPDVVDSMTNVRIDTLPADGVLTLNGVAVSAGQVIPVADIGNLVFTPDEHESGAGYTSFTFSVQDQDGLFDATPNTISVNVAPVTDAPDLSVSAPSRIGMDEHAALNISTSLVDTDGSETLAANIGISNIPDGAQILGPGDVPYAIAGGVASVPVADLGSIVFVPPAGETGSVSLVVSSTATDGVAASRTTSRTIEIMIAPPAEYVIPADTSPILGEGDGGGAAVGGVVSPSSGGGFYGSVYSGMGQVGIDVLPDIRFFDTGMSRDFGSFVDNINFDYDIARPDFWIAGAVDQKLMIETKEMSFQVPKSIFRHSNASEKLSFEAELQDGSPLPGWLVFDPESLTFKGTPPAGSPEALEIVIIAKDTRNDEVRAPVRVVINRDVDEVGGTAGGDVPADNGGAGERGGAAAGEDAGGDVPDNIPAPVGDGAFVFPPVGNDLGDVADGSTAGGGRLSFSEQLRLHGDEARFAGNEEFLKSLSL